MSLANLHSELLLAEMQTDGHAPLKFVCSDGNIYYCKYLKTMNKEEVNCLAYNHGFIFQGINNIGIVNSSLSNYTQIFLFQEGAG